MLKTKYQKKIKINSEKNFGIVFSIFFLLLFCYNFIFNNQSNYFIFSISLFFIFFSYFKSKIFYYPNRVWFKIGIVLGVIVSPIIIFILFYFIISPFGFIAKLFNKKLLDKKLDKSKKTYWIKRNSPINTMKDQF